MICPECGHENVEDALYCAQCGSQILRAEEDGAPSDSDAEASEPEFSTNEPEFAEPVDEAMPPVGVRAEGETKDNQKRIVPIVATVVAIVALVVFAIIHFGHSSGPDDETIQNCMELTDNYGTGYQVAFDNVQVTVTQKEIRPLRGEDASYAKSRGYEELWDVEADVEAETGLLTFQGTVVSLFALDDGEWILVEDYIPDGMVVSTKRGPTEEEIEGWLPTILTVAALPKDYSSSDLHVGSIDYSQGSLSCEVTIEAKHTGAFTEMSGSIQATFAARSDGWQLDGCVASEDIATVSLEPMVGTWVGEFQTTSQAYTDYYVTDRMRCYGAEGHQFVLVITAVDPTSGRIEGSYTCLEHCHETVLYNDVTSSEGDVETGPHEFVATLTADWGGTYSFTFKEPEGGSPDFTTIRISFGEGNIPGGGVAEVTSMHRYTGQAFVGTHDITVQVTDTYAITKQEG